MKFKNTEFKLIPGGKVLVVRGKNGLIKKVFEGKDTIFFDDKIFIFTSAAKRVLLKLVLKCFEGVSGGYFLELVFVGLGYRFIKLDKYILIKVGQSHYAKLPVPHNVHILGYKKRMIFFGLSLISVQRLIYFVRLLRQPDIYKGKGILYLGEKVVLKIGKQK